MSAVAAFGGAFHNTPPPAPVTASTTPAIVATATTTDKHTSAKSANYFDNIIMPDGTRASDTKSTGGAGFLSKGLVKTSVSVTPWATLENAALPYALQNGKTQTSIKNENGDTRYYQYQNGQWLYYTQPPPTPTAQNIPQPDPARLAVALRYCAERPQYCNGTNFWNDYYNDLTKRNIIDALLWIWIV